MFKSLMGGFKRGASALSRGQKAVLVGVIFLFGIGTLANTLLIAAGPGLRLYVALRDVAVIVIVTPLALLNLRASRTRPDGVPLYGLIFIMLSIVISVHALRFQFLSPVYK